MQLLRNKRTGVVFGYNKLMAGMEDMEVFEVPDPKPKKAAAAPPPKKKVVKKTAPAKTPAVDVDDLDVLNI